MTKEKSDLKSIRQVLLPREDYHPFPRYDDREAWEALPQEVKSWYLDKKQELLDFQSSAFSAVQYMGYYRTNSAADYHTHINARRSALLNAVIAECIAHDGKLLDKIIDLIWATCEESSWIDPDHNNHMHDHMLSGVIKNALPDVTDFNFVDLVAANTASLLGWTYYLLKEPLDALTPMVCERIELEIYKRVVIPFMHHDDLTWFGFYGHKINNWNPWITSNIVCAALLTVKDPDLRAKFFARALEKLDIYIGVCPADGGCDEGPGYWGAAGAALYDCFALFSAATGGRLSFFDEPLIKNIGEYICKANLYGDAYANFADNGMRLKANALMLYRFGRDVGSKKLQSFACAQYCPGPVPVAYTQVMRGLYDLFFSTEMPRLAQQNREPFVPGCCFLPDTQTLFARDNANLVQFAAKGGFNNESHNHNDLGHFILLYQGEPIFPDLGNLPYTARTFSPFRYEIWILQSAYHNCAAIRGFDQHDGDNFRAQVLAYEDTEKEILLSLQLKGAYVPQAGVEDYVRTFTFCKENGLLHLQDRITLDTADDDVSLHFITVVQPEILPGTVRVPVKDTAALLRFDPEKACVCTDSHDLENEGQKKQWKTDCCWRTHLKSKEKSTLHVFDLDISME